MFFSIEQAWYDAIAINEEKIITPIPTNFQFDLLFLSIQESNQQTAKD